VDLACGIQVHSLQGSTHLRASMFRHNAACLPPRNSQQQ
jgi:hypothetical protein